MAVTPADHAWQNAVAGTSDRVHQDVDACWFWLETPDGTIWAPGDSRLIRDHHLSMPAPDALLSTSPTANGISASPARSKMANAYSDTPLLLHHWGSVDAPDFPPFNGDPTTLYELVTNPDRIQVLVPGQPCSLNRLIGA